ncbi:hypothetical protein C9374_009929 [Naegleria lovaniensis]|uniref:E2F/DP family winged-helix DNA-binding domain-containing protein n=1 Tax=Naegleria lovaniensis TaxID=51637 RepID=A0AA88KGX8_NAELO|nr:uncharacterized protein C9374_009929 [Naegleria lovaniensis]KAG2375306.1 hypothetical protein C9374_009929 [Naegleria lovaniensis]
MKTNNKTSTTTTTPSYSSITTTTTSTNHHHHDVDSTGRNYRMERKQEEERNQVILEEGYSACQASTIHEADAAKDDDGPCKKVNCFRSETNYQGPADDSRPPSSSSYSFNAHSLPLPIASSEDETTSSTENSDNNDNHYETTLFQSGVQQPSRSRTLSHLTVHTMESLMRSEATVVLHGSSVPSSSANVNNQNFQKSPPPPPTFPTLPGVIETAHPLSSVSNGMTTPATQGMFPFSFTHPKQQNLNQLQSLPQSYDSPCGNIPLDSQSCTSSSSTVTQGGGITEEKKTKNRKEKSLTMICAKFIQFYENLKNSNAANNNQSKGEIKIEEAVNTLGIEKRRIYDILNVLESISIVSKVGVSCYKYHGTKSLSTTLEQMKSSALEDATLLEGLKSLPKTPQNEPLLQCLPKFKQNINAMTPSRSNTLTSLSRLLIMSFLVTETKEMSQDQLVSIVLKDSAEKTRTRRLNDIVNILSGIHLIEKRSEKSVNYFKWLGTLPKQETTIFSPSKMPIKKRKRTTSKLSNSSVSEEHSPCSDDATSPSSTFSAIDTPQSSNVSNTESDSASSYSSSSQSSTPYSPFFHTTVTTPKSSSSVTVNNVGGLHFQFRSPPSKKNKPSPTLTAPASLSKNLQEMFTSKPVQEKKLQPISPRTFSTTTPAAATGPLTSNQHKNLTVSIPVKPLSTNISISSSICPTTTPPQQSKTSPFVTTLGSFRFATANLQPLQNSVNTVKPNTTAPCSISPLAILKEEKNKENCLSTPLNKSAETLRVKTMTPSPSSNPSKGSFTVKIRSPLQPLSPSELSVLNQQQNIQTQLNTKKK